MNDKQIPAYAGMTSRMIIKNYILILIALALTTACHRTLTRDEMVAYVQNPKHGLVQEKELNGTLLKLSYKPYQLLAQQEMDAADSLTPTKQKEILERYSKQYYFVLSISQGGKEILSNAADRQRFSMLVSQFAFNMNQSVTLATAEQDTLPLLDFVYPRMYGMAPSTDILFVFKKEENPTPYITFYINEFGLFTGNTRFTINTRNLKKINSKHLHQ